MSRLNNNPYITYIIIIIVAIILLELPSKIFNINEDLNGLIINFLFAIGSLFILFAWEFKIFILLNVFGFIKLNIGLITNNLINPDWISGELNFSLQIAKLIMTVLTFLMIIAGFQNQLKLGSWKELIEINKRKIVLYYTLGTIFLQLIIRLV